MKTYKHFSIPRSVKNIFLFVIVFWLSLSCGSTDIIFESQNTIFPEDAGVIDVTKSPYNAYGDGRHDDTSAIQRAFDDYINQNRIIYLPNGTYLVSDTIRWGPSNDPDANLQKRTILQGQSTKGAIVKLKDNSPGFEDIKVNSRGENQCKSAIWTGKSPAQRFRNAVRNITIDTGSNNKGACGLQFNASNQGTVRNLRIISGDGQGLYGLDLAYTGEIGPAYIKNIYIQGFDYAIYGHYGNSVTIENIEIKDQNIAGIRHDSSLFLKDLKSTQSKLEVQAIRNESESSNMTVLNADLHGNDPKISAIYNQGGLYGRNIFTSGYLGAIYNSQPDNSSPELARSPEKIDEFVSHDVLSLYDSPNTSLHIPFEETPEIPWERDLSKWANPIDYGADADESHSDSEAIQAAIDDPSKTVVYFPAGIKFRIDGDVFIRGNIERIIGTEHEFSQESVNGRFIFDEGTAENVVFERIMASYADVELVHDSTRTLIISSFQGPRITGNGSGKLFIDDYGGNVKGYLRFNNPNMKVFGRSINTEPWKPSQFGIINNGAKVWIFGYKTEGTGTQILTSNSGMTELLGGFIYSTTEIAGEQIFAVDEANMSIAGLRQSVTGGDRSYQNFVRETRSGETRYLSESYGFKIPLYVGYKKNLVAN